jgi:hypothetical protein
MDKQVVLRVYTELLDKKIQEAGKALESIHRGIDTAPTPSESHSDTTRSQQSRVAMEMEERLSSLRKTRAEAGMVQSGCSAIGALIVLEDSVLKDQEYYFVVPGQGGESLFFDDIEVLSVSTNAPILEPISRAKVGERFEFRGRTLTLVEMS